MIALNWIMKRLEKEIKKAKSNNPFEIADRKNIIVNFLPLGNTLGFYMKNVRHQVITLNSELDESLKNFVCAHELGHAVLHPDENTPFLHKNTLLSRSKIEREANEWAVRLILYGEELEDFETKSLILRNYGIPMEMERFL